MATSEENAQAAEDALNAILSSGTASYSIGNRSKQSLDIEKLEKVQEKLEFKADRAANGIFRVAKLRRPR